MSGAPETTEPWTGVYTTQLEIAAAMARLTLATSGFRRHAKNVGPAHQRTLKQIFYYVQLTFNQLPRIRVSLACSPGSLFASQRVAGS